MATEEQVTYNKDYYEANKSDIQEKKKNRYETDPEYRKMIKRRATERYFRNKFKKNASKYAIESLDDMEFDARNMRIFIHGDERIKLVSASAFAKIIGVSTATIRNWIENEIIPNQTHGLDTGEAYKKWFSFKYIENVAEVLQERKYSDWDTLKELMMKKFEEKPDFTFELKEGIDVGANEMDKVTEIFGLTIGKSHNGVEIY